MKIINKTMRCQYQSTVYNKTMTLRLKNWLLVSNVLYQWIAPSQSHLFFISRLFSISFAPSLSTSHSLSFAFSRLFFFFFSRLLEYYSINNSIGSNWAVCTKMFVDKNKSALYHMTISLFLSLSLSYSLSVWLTPFP